MKWKHSGLVRKESLVWVNIRLTGSTFPHCGELRDVMVGTSEPLATAS